MKTLRTLLWILPALILSLAFGCEGDMGGTPYTEYSYYIYMANNGNDSITSYTFSAETEALTPIEDAGTANPPTSLCIEPGGNFLYAAASGIGTTANTLIFEIQSGGLLSVPTTYTTNFGTHALAINPSGNFLYITNQTANTVSKAQGARTGILSSIAAENTDVGSPREIAMHPAGKYLYVVNSATVGTYGNSISGYRLDGSTGNLTAITGSPFPTATSPNFIVISPVNELLYANYSSSDSITIFLIGTNGALSENFGISPFSPSLGQGPSGMVFHPSGKYLFIANTDTSDITVCEVNAATGGLKEIDSSPFPARSGPYALAVEPTGRFLFCANRDYGNMTVYAILRSGELVKKAESDINTGSSPYALAVLPRQ